MRMFLVVPVLALAAAACASEAQPAPTQNAGVDRGTATYDSSIVNRETNTYQVAYPTSDIGTAAATWKAWNSKTNHGRTTPGQRLRNYKFLGYQNADVNSAITTVTMADYFDPEQKHADGPIKLVHLQAAGVWCSACRSEAASLRKIHDGLRAEGVIWLTTVCEGKDPGVESNLADLKSWITSTKGMNTTVLDPGNFNLGVFYKAAAIPWNAWIDARTMEIMDYHEGAPADLRGDVDNALEKFSANAPRD
jgi:hypothetical protein